MRRLLKATIELVKRFIVLSIIASLSCNTFAVERVTYYHNDSLGSPVAATDNIGNLLWREEYEPYGERILREDSGTNNLWFTGKQEEEDFGISYFGARWYDPSIGRFMAIDPTGFNHKNIQSFNRYAYANNNPYLFTDPNGKSAALAPYLLLIGGLILFTIATSSRISSDTASNAGFGDSFRAELGRLSSLVFNEEADSADQTDKEIDGLTDGLENEKDTRGRDREGNFIDPEGNAEDKLAGLTGESDGKGGKILPDGSRAGIHDSTGRSGGKIGESAGSKTLHVNRPPGKKNIKIRFPNN
jgi:RHS repeat-associated protein